MCIKETISEWSRTYASKLQVILFMVCGRAASKISLITHEHIDA